VPDPQIDELRGSECRELLAGRHLGRLALVDGRGPVILPVNYVVVRGALGEVTDPEDLARLRALPLYPWAPGDKARYLRVRPASLTGRRIRIPDELPFTWWG
jgi:hypothetical protein